MSDQRPAGAEPALRLVVNTQTPLVRFRRHAAAPEGAELAQLEEGVDYKMTTGGVTRMLRPLLRAWLTEGRVATADWVAMGSLAGTPDVAHEGIRLSFVDLDRSTKKAYAVAKEHMWALLNADPSTATSQGRTSVPADAWSAFERYQAISTEALRRVAEDRGGIDLLYVHDFQQIGVAALWNGPPTPKVFHLHTPFPGSLADGWREWFVERLEHYDHVIVSTQRYAENLKAAGLRTPISVVHPFIDPKEQQTASPDAITRFRAKYRIPDEAIIVLNVARMDPMKGQDRLLRALPHVLREVPEAHAVFVGNGSFSSSSEGGLGLSKGERWRRHLEGLVDELGLQRSVTFTGHVEDALLPAAYASASAFCLPSIREGFGLAAVEAWRHARPVVVCERAGVSELVEDHVNGRTVDCDDAEALAEAIVELVSDPWSARQGENGFDASRAATMDVGRRAIEAIMQRLTEKEVHASH